MSNSAAFDRPTRLRLLQEVNYECQLRYRGCTVGATEIADCGELKAACKSCRMAREDRKSQGQRMAAARLRRAQG